ncbi:probable pectinesterase/pectinesterase inhibitor 36 [Pistacia vera]|uniref:probable pectinesterase/pectinesterase inhibitor 36 n=1 Tax=Pistacia vera TaxID=55513 RepID=UPI0012638B6B|nr:probable pectinesterase/pectinesterase inhibitor 36 [Pistacia vera]
MATTTSCTQELEVVQMARSTVLQARNWARASVTPNGLELDQDLNSHNEALTDCAKLYGESESRLGRLLAGENHTLDDARAWLSSALAHHRTCLDGLEERGYVQSHAETHNLTMFLSEALQLHRKKVRRGPPGPGKASFNQNGGILASWSPATSKADFVVAQDGSGTHRTIIEALAALGRMGNRRPQRVIIHVKPGVYNEKADIKHHMKNIMFVGDGIGRNIVTGSRNVPDASTTSTSATFGVSGDGFWARDMTFQNTAGPHKHQAVALRVSSDLSVFYRCSFIGHQDTLYVLSLRQIYRDCQIHGTIDFIFGDAIAVFQNCDIFIRRPIDHQATMITAQGRDDPNENTGLSIQGPRVRPSHEFIAVQHLFTNYLGRPWKKYSRTTFIKTDLGRIIHPKGWTEWDGSFALSTLYYAEYLNTGAGAFTENRVNWPGFRVLNSPQQASPFSVRRFIQGNSWIRATGVPFWPEI